MAVGNRVASAFFLHVGTFVAFIVYLVLALGGGNTLPAVRTALVVALVLHSGYWLLARAVGENKHFDLSLWLIFAVGLVGVYVAPSVVLPLFQHYVGVVLFLTLALTGLVPLVLGRETFTYHNARRQTPAWMQKLPSFDKLNRIITVYWMGLFVTCAGLVAWAPEDPRFTLLYPNLLIAGLGFTAPLWLVPLYFRFAPPPLPTAIEPILLGMPLVFDRRAAGTARAEFQFHVSGPDAGDYVVRVANGRCETFAGRSPKPDVTVHTPDAVWVKITHGQLDGTQALMQGLYRAEGDVMLLTKLQEWFGGRR
jgi:hypothetical protein